MRTTFAAALAALAVTVALPARAQTKIGYVDFQRALNEVDEGKNAKAQLKKEFEAKQKTLSEREDEIRKLQGDFTKQQGVMNEQTRGQKQEELARKAQDLQTTYLQLQKELSDRERDMTRGLFDKMYVIVREIAEADGFDLVLDRQVVVFGSTSLELTDELIRKYNGRHKATAAAPAAKAGEAKKAEPKKAEAKPAGK